MNMHKTVTCWPGKEVTFTGRWVLRYSAAHRRLMWLPVYRSQDGEEGLVAEYAKGLLEHNMPVFVRRALALLRRISYRRERR